MNCAPAWSGDVNLQQMQPTLDTSTPAVKPPQTTLNGQVTREDAADRPAAQPGAGGIINAAGGIFINGQRVGNTMTGQQLQDALEKINATRAKLRAQDGPRILFGGKRAAVMSTEDYRKMQYGVVGMVSRMTDGPPVVLQVFPTCPAAKAGIRPGDSVVRVGERKLRGGDGQYVFWKTVAGKADTPVDVTVLRDGEVLNFHLIRMNIEDIQNTKIRENYERILSLLGPPVDTTSSNGDADESSSSNPKSQFIDEASELQSRGWRKILPDASLDKDEDK